LVLSTVRVYLSGNPVHDRVLEAFYEGCPEEKALVRNFEYQPSDVAVIFGVYKSKVPLSFPRGRVFSQQRSVKKDVLVLETGYINRGDGINHHYAAGFNGLNGRADFRNKGMPGDRAGLLGVDLKPWRKDGDHILLCGQVPWDASVDHVDFNGWMLSTHDYLQRFRRKIVARTHPQIRDPGVPLSKHLENCWAVVTFNSNAGVEAVINGIPAFAADPGSMAWDVANIHLEEMEYPRMSDRGQWLNDLAYAQWTPAEMSNGDAWRHLFRS
jgi:hypothetical protein